MRSLVYWLYFLVLPSTFAADDFLTQSKAVATHYSDLVLAGYEDSLTGALALQKSVERFTGNPNPQSLAKARQAWITARQPYLQTEVFRFYGGPIDDGDGPEIFINAWPIDEAYIDYVEGIPNSGIINDLRAFPEITAQLLQTANERGGETMISCGYHAIEFLLWGQDFRDDGPGDRPITDYTDGPNAQRRASYINVCCQLLIKHLESLVIDWSAENSDGYRQQFLAEPLKAVWNIVAGAKHLSGTEMAGERLLVAWDTQAQEDEHSCFSDTTCQDLILDVQGLVNVYDGTYRRTDGELMQGPGLNSLLQWLAPETRQQLDSLIPRSLLKAAMIPSPFDQAILGDRDNAPGRKAVIECVEALEDQSFQWARVEQGLIAKIRD